MDGSPADGREDELGRWLEPFLARLRRKAQRHWAPFYVKGLILPGERKGVEPMAARVAPGDPQQLHHFASTPPRVTAPLEDELVRAADRLAGGPDAVLAGDDTALGQRGATRSASSASTAASSGRGRTASRRPRSPWPGPRCRSGSPRLFPPEDLCAGFERRPGAGAPEAVGYRPKWTVALDG